METKTYRAKSVMIGRKPRVGNNKYKTAVVSMFAQNNPHTAGDVPKEMLEYPNIEKVRINNLINVSYYLEGNDMVINDLDSVVISLDKHILTITGKQTI